MFHVCWMLAFFVSEIDIKRLLNAKTYIISFLKCYPIDISSTIFSWQILYVYYKYKLGSLFFLNVKMISIIHGIDLTTKKPLHYRILLLTPQLFILKPKGLGTCNYIVWIKQTKILFNWLNIQRLSTIVLIYAFEK